MNILCTSVGNDGFSAVLHALRQQSEWKIYGCDSDPLAYGIDLCDGGILIPQRNTPEELLAKLDEIIVRYKIDVVLPLSTEDQPFYAAHKDRIERAGAKLAASSYESVKNANNKHFLYRLCKSKGYPVPDFQIVDNKKELLSIIKTYERENRSCVLKLALGTGAQGVKIVTPDVKPDSRFWSRNNTTVSSQDVEIWLDSQDENITDVMITDFLPGIHISIDCFKTPDQKFCAVARSELRHLYGMGIAGEIVSEPQAEETARRLGDDLDLTYCYNVEFKADSNGILKIMEINPRFPASIGHTVAAGINFPVMAIQLATNSLPQDISATKISACTYRRFWNWLPK